MTEFPEISARLIKFCGKWQISSLLTLKFLIEFFSIIALTKAKPL